MPTPTPSAPEVQTSPPLFMALQILGRVVLTLMAATIVYAAWMVIKNWSSVGV